MKPLSAALLALLLVAAPSAAPAAARPVHGMAAPALRLAWQDPEENAGALGNQNGSDDDEGDGDEDRPPAARGPESRGQHAPERLAPVPPPPQPAPGNEPYYPEEGAQPEEPAGNDGQTGRQF